MVLSMQMKKEIIEEQLAGLPLVQYAWLETAALPFSGRVREICRAECPRYGKSWSCPPGVGTVQECKERCQRYEGALLFTTIAEVVDVENLEETLATRGAHEKVAAEVRSLLREQFSDTLALSADSCALCSACTFPEEPCRLPEKMVPCMEGYGIVVPRLAEQTGIAFENGPGTVTWFGMILFTDSSHYSHKRATI